ncbi:MAG: penicillin-binding protein activator LpoB [Treponema sp.]|nr:penicillin-binding protein activator LpoB [Treponema sp.]
MTGQGSLWCPFRRIPKGCPGYLIGGIIEAFVRTGRFAVVSRDEMELALVRGELDFNMSAEVDDQTAQLIGRFLGAQLIATGAFESHGDTFRLRLRAIEVETAVIRGTHTETVRNGRTVRYLLGNTDPSRFWSLGASVGTFFADPWLAATIQATLAPLGHSFVRVGCEFGFISGTTGADYFSVFPFAHIAFFLPFDDLPIPFARGGWHISAGGGLKIEEYRFAHFVLTRRVFMADFVTGFVVGDMLDISYTLRTDFSSISNRVSVGFTHRFQ